MRGESLGILRKGKDVAGLQGVNGVGRESSVFLGDRETCKVVGCDTYIKSLNVKANSDQMNASMKDHEMV